MVPPARAPSSNMEREVKLDAGLRFSLPELSGALPGVTAVALADSKLQATYIDTPDLRLMRWGITVRHRHDVVGGAGAESAWTVKLPAAADGVALVRRELSWPGKLGPVPVEVAQLVKAPARSATLGPVAKLTTQRRRVELRDTSGRRLAEIDDDVVSVLDGRQLAARFRQVEVEVEADAPLGLLEAVVARVVAAGAIPGDDRPKVVRAIGPRATLGPDVVAPRLGPSATIAETVAAAIAAGVSRMIRHDPGVRLGDDAEHVHQARVGTRRLRSDLRTFRPLLDGEWVAEIRNELGWAAAALGEVRDADVLTERMEARIAALPASDARPGAAVLKRLATQRDEARARLLDVLNSDRYVALLDALTEAAADPPLLAALDVAAPAGLGRSNGNGSGAANGTSTAPVEVWAEGPGQPLTALGLLAPSLVVASPSEPDGAPEPPQAISPLVDRPSDQLARDVLPRLVRRPWRHLNEAVGVLGDHPEDLALHEVRIRSKRLRYAAEAAAPVIGKPAQRLASAAAGLQGVLGDMNDAVVAEAWLRQVAAAGSAAQAMVAGELIALERQEQQVGRDSWSKSWRVASNPKLRAWLKG
jgi:CHAD domain-containing protein